MSKVVQIVDGKKSCTKCKRLLPLTGFSPNRRYKSGYASWCKKCCNERGHSKRIRQEHREKGLCPNHNTPVAPGYKSCVVCLDRNKQRYRNGHNTNRKRYYALKDEIYHAYGGYICRCCGETNPLFLTLDHINNDGAEHRKVLSHDGTGRWVLNTYRWLKANNYPPIIQVLCYNCNCGKARNKGICPHKHELTFKAVA